MVPTSEPWERVGAGVLGQPLGQLHPVGRGEHVDDLVEGHGVGGLLVQQPPAGDGALGQRPPQTAGGRLRRALRQGLAGGSPQHLDGPLVVLWLGLQQVHGDSPGHRAVAVEQARGPAVRLGPVGPAHAAADRGAHERVDEVQRPSGGEDRGGLQGVGGVRGGRHRQLADARGVPQPRVAAQHRHRAGQCDRIGGKAPPAAA
jgi:hypothetical protein